MATATVTNSLVNGTTVDAVPLNTNFNDLVTFLNASVVHVDGSQAMTGNLAMGSNKMTGLAAPTAAGDAARKADSDAVQTNLDTHKTSSDHDGQYYTETEINALLDQLYGFDAAHSGRRIFIQSGTPTADGTNDLWIDTT